MRRVSPVAAQLRDQIVQLRASLCEEPESRAQRLAILGWGRRLAGPRVGLLAALLLALSPFHVYYSQEVRMYGLVTLLGLAAFSFLLYFMPTIMGTMADRIGFRELKVKGRKFLLNGKSFRLRGYNRHEDHPQFGCAIPVPAMVTDLELMRDLGCDEGQGYLFKHLVPEADFAVLLAGDVL